MGRKRNLRDLTDAMSAGQPVMARRNLWKADHLEGFVVAVDQEWAVLNLIYDVGLNGWSAIRLDTIRDVERQRAEAFITRAQRPSTSTRRRSTSWCAAPPPVSL